MAAASDRPRTIFERFYHSEVSGSIVLLVCTVVALAWANSAWSDSYFEFIHTYVKLSWGEATFKLSLQHWVNDFLMALFFFVVGLEIKRELVVGHLSDPRRAILPVSAAVGGMVLPALVYVIFNPSGEAARGWGVPMATDIAFALGILALLGSRIPIGLKVFLTALAIADDMGAVLVIALFYTESIQIWPLVLAGGFMAAIVWAGRRGVRGDPIYVLLGLGVVFSVFASGIHATVAGILVALLVPIRSRIDPDEFLARSRAGLNQLEQANLSRQSLIEEREQLRTVNAMLVAGAEMRPVGITLEHMLHPVQAFLVLPLFALVNAGVRIDTGAISSGLDPVTLGIVAGLFLGKQVGVTLFTWLAVRSGRASLPDGCGWPQILGVSALAGVGFTMSLFISELAFLDPRMVSEAKIGILIASLISGVWGFLVLRATVRRPSVGA